MQSFSWIQTSLSLIVALSITRLMVSASVIYIAREKLKGDWIPCAWAVCIFFLALQFSWVFISLGKLPINWSFGIFLCLLGMVLPLFFASALILPNTEYQAGDDLHSWFAKNGRIALLCFAFYCLAVYPFNWYFFDLAMLDRPHAGIAAGLALIGFFTHSRRVLATVTALELGVIIYFAVRMLLHS